MAIAGAVFAAAVLPVAVLDFRAFWSDVVLYNAGMDPHERSPVGGLPGITRDVLAARERIVFQWCRDRGVPVAFVLAGGYLGPGLDERGLTDLHRLTVSAAQAIFA